jgi:hypothetical protein
LERLQFVIHTHTHTHAHTVSLYTHNVLERLQLPFHTHTHTVSLYTHNHPIAFCSYPPGLDQRDHTHTQHTHTHTHTKGTWERPAATSAQWAAHSRGPCGHIISYHIISYCIVLYHYNRLLRLPKRIVESRPVVQEHPRRLGVAIEGGRVQAGQSALRGGAVGGGRGRRASS